MTNKNKIIFFGTPVFAAIVLEMLSKSKFKPAAVVTEPDKPVGRKQILTPPAVKVVAQKYNIPILQPEKIRNLKLPLGPELGVEGEIRNLKPDLMILAAYGQMIPSEILNIPTFGSLNVHPSLLPKYRGASPIQTAILNGDKETGVTIILMDEKVDHGPIITNDKKLITNNKITTEELSKELAEFGAELLIKTLPKWLAGEIRPMPQDDLQATYTRQIKKEDGKIDWQKTAEEIERIVRAYWPWPSAYTKLNEKNIKIIKADILESECNERPGTVFLTSDKKIAVACGKNTLILQELQLEGKRPMGAQEFFNGHPEIIDSQFG